MIRITCALLTLATLTLVAPGCGSDSNDSTQSAPLDCGGSGTGSHCTIVCDEWVVQCDRNDDERIMCTCIEGPRTGTTFEQADACTSSTFVAQEQCS